MLYVALETTEETILERLHWLSLWNSIWLFNFPSFSPTHVIDHQQHAVAFSAKFHLVVEFGPTCHYWACRQVVLSESWCYWVFGFYGIVLALFRLPLPNILWPYVGTIQLQLEDRFNQKLNGIISHCSGQICFCIVLLAIRCSKIYWIQESAFLVAPKDIKLSNPSRARVVLSSSCQGRVGLRNSPRKCQHAVADPH